MKKDKRASPTFQVTVIYEVCVNNTTTEMATRMLSLIKMKAPIRIRDR